MSHPAHFAVIPVALKAAFCFSPLPSGNPAIRPHARKEYDILTKALLHNSSRIIPGPGLSLQANCRPQVSKGPPCRRCQDIGAQPSGCRTNLLHCSLGGYQRSLGLSRFCSLKAALRCTYGAWRRYRNAPLSRRLPVKVSSSDSICGFPHTGVECSGVYSVNELQEQLGLHRRSGYSAPPCLLTRGQLSLRVQPHW